MVTSSVMLVLRRRLLETCRRPAVHSVCNFVLMLALFPERKLKIETAVVGEKEQTGNKTGQN